MNSKNKKNFALQEKQKQEKIRNKFMTNGVTLIAPETIFLSANTKIGKNVVINPYVVIGSNVKIGNNVEILSFTHIEGAKIENNVKVGPFSRVRPGVVISKKSRIEPGQTWVGNPARRLKTNMYALNKSDIDEFVLLEETARWTQLIKQRGL